MKMNMDINMNGHSIINEPFHFFIEGYYDKSLHSAIADHYITYNANFKSFMMPYDCSLNEVAF